MRHPLVNRTSPTGPGKPFVGTCAACGKQGLTRENMFSDECPNQRGMTNEQALIEAIEGDDPPSNPPCATILELAP
jgi:hypothetical protein